MSHYPSKERVVRDDVLVYPEGAPIPAEDTEELKRQGYLDSKGTPVPQPEPEPAPPTLEERVAALEAAAGKAKAATPGANKAATPGANK